MAIATLKKIEILGHNSEHDPVLECLQQEGQVEVVDLKDKSDEYKHFAFEQQTIRYEDVTEAVEKLSWLKSFFESVAETKRSPLASRPVVRREELADLLRHFDYGALYSRGREMESSLKHLEKKGTELESRRKELLPWGNLDVPLEAVGETDFTGSTLGCVRRRAFLPLKELLESSPGAYLEVVDGDKATVCVFVAYLKSAEEEVNELLRQHEFTFHHLPHYRGRVADILNDIDAEEEELDFQHAARLEEARGLLSEETKVSALLDYFSNVERKESAKGHLLYSRETFFLHGWIRKDDAGAAQKKLSDRFDTVEVYLSDPSPDDVLPVVLENRNAVRPFEFLTGIYGYPSYQDVDPTPFMAPFFFVFFGYCLGDAVYGLVMVLVSLFALKKFKMGPQGNRFCRLLLYCGLSTIAMGALTSGWLGDLSKYILGVTIPAIWVNPQDKPTAVLNVALYLGIVQIWVGYGVAAYANIRNRRYFASLVDQGPVFLLLAGLTGIGLIFLKTISAEFTKLSVALLAAGAVVILAGHGRHEQSVAGKVGFGLLSLYSATTGYLSDILSYSRLWALGLVTAAMASTVNLMAATIAKLIPVVGIVLGIVIAVVLHAVFLLVNALGAFVHPVRLQFVEFFSKFFKSTGKAFQPLTIENRFTVIEE